MISKSKIRGETRKLKVGLKKKGVTSATTRRMSYAIMSALLIFTLASSSILSSVLLVVHAQEEDEDEGVVDNNNEDLMTSTSSSSSSSNPGLISSENQDNQGNNDSMAGDDLEETSSDEIEGESSSGDPGELSTSSDDCPEGQQRDANGNCIIAPIESTNLATTSTFSNGANNATATNDLANQSSLVHEIGPNANIDRCSGLQRPQLIDPRPPEVKLAECRINEKYEQLRNNGLDLGEPTAIVTASQNGNGVFYRDFQSGSIYFIPDRGTFETHGAIWEKYKEKDRENGFLELPKEGTRTLPENRGLVQIFDGGVIYWSGDTGAHELHNGPILNTYARLGYEKSQLGFPITDESPALREGKYNHFQSGAIYWAPELDGAYAVYGPIYEKWKSIGWEHSELGFPISDTGQPPFGDVDSPGMDSVSNGDQYSRFQEGAISWSASTGQTYIHLNPLKFAITFNKIHVYESHDYIGCRSGRM
jgi:hypothetical protein